MLFEWQCSARGRTELKPGFSFIPFPFSIRPFYMSPISPVLPKKLGLGYGGQTSITHAWYVLRLCKMAHSLFQGILLVINLGGLWCSRPQKLFCCFPSNSGCQFVVKNKIITDPPCCKWFHNYAGSFQGSALVIFPQDWFSQINEWD